MFYVKAHKLFIWNNFWYLVLWRTLSTQFSWQRWSDESNTRKQ